MREIPPTAHSAPTQGRTDALLDVAGQLYARVSGGDDGLAYNVDGKGAALTIVGADGQRRAVAVGSSVAGAAPAWQRAREIRGGVEQDRRWNPWVLLQHLRGNYSVAPAAAGWVAWAALDIDAHPSADVGTSELAARRLAGARATAVLATVWRAFGCSAERHPIVLRSPGGGYHVWFPLTRGVGSANAEHTWPAAVVRAWFERHLLAAGLELAPGVLEVYPSGRCLRAPCGRGSVLLRATRPDEPDALGLEPWPGTMGEARIDWQGVRPALSSASRRVAPMVETFVAQWDAQRRTLADWLGRPEADWDPAWGFLGWRAEPDGGPDSKNSEQDAGPILTRSQESDDVSAPLLAGGVRAVSPGGDAAVRSGQGRDPGSALLLTDSKKNRPTALTSDVPPVPVAATVLRGRDFKGKVQRLLASGITEPGTRHDAVLTLVFYWGATCGLGEPQTLARLEAWCEGHPHLESRLSVRRPRFRKTCLREARHYYAHHSARWRFRGQGDGGGLATLTAADQSVVAAADVSLRGDVATILAWLAGRADATGRIGEPVQIASGLLARLCGDRRVVGEDGKRHRSTTLAMRELERLGVLTLAANYRVGKRGRQWCCWYQFGSGTLPRTRTLAAAVWDEIEIQRAPRRPAKPPIVRDAASTALTSADPPNPTAATARPAPDAVVVYVVGERVVPEGLLQVLTDGVRGVARTLLALAADVARPTAAVTARAAWFVRPYQGRTFTPAELRSADFATIVPWSDLEARRRLTRREKLAAGAPVVRARGTHGPAVPPEVSDVVAGAALPTRSPATVLGGDVPSSARVASEHDSRAELTSDLGEGAAALPLEIADIAARAWRAWRRRTP